MSDYKSIEPLESLIGTKHQRVFALDCPCIWQDHIESEMFLINRDVEDELGRHIAISINVHDENRRSLEITAYEKLPRIIDNELVKARLDFLSSVWVPNQEIRRIQTLSYRELEQAIICFGVGNEPLFSFLIDWNTIQFYFGLPLDVRRFGKWQVCRTVSRRP